MKKKLAAIAIAASLVLVGCGSDSSSDETAVDNTDVSSEAQSDLIALLEENAELSTFYAALESTGELIRMQGSQHFTVFAPTNDAFAALPEGLLDKLLLPENNDLLVRILTYHLINTGTYGPAVFTADVVPGEILSLEGSLLAMDNANGVTVNGVSVITADIEAKTCDTCRGRGVIHIIDQVLIPPTVDLSGL